MTLTLDSLAGLFWWRWIFLKKKSLIIFEAVIYCHIRKRQWFYSIKLKGESLEWMRLAVAINYDSQSLDIVTSFTWNTFIVTIAIFLWCKCNRSKASRLEVCDCSFHSLFTFSLNLINRAFFQSSRIKNVSMLAPSLCGFTTLVSSKSCFNLETKDNELCLCDVIAKVTTWECAYNSRGQLWLIHIFM